MRTHRLVNWRGGLWRYVRAVPRDVVGEIGKTAWTSNLGRVSLADAEKAAAILDQQTDAQVRRLRGLNDEARAALVRAGGVAGLEADAAALEGIAAQVAGIVGALEGRAGREEAAAAARHLLSVVREEAAAAARRLENFDRLTVDAFEVVDVNADNGST